MGSMVLGAPTKVFEAVKVPQQKVVNGVPFPLVVQPTTTAAAGNLAMAVREHKPWLEGKLHESGAMLFRGFDVPKASVFDGVVDSFGWEDFPFAGVIAPRAHIVGRVHTANDSPPHLSVEFHNEMSYMVKSPAKVFFYCEVEPAGEGETPIVLGHRVYDRLKQNHSTFLQHLEEHGVVYPSFIPNETDYSYSNGKSWKDTFGIDDKTLVEQILSHLEMKVEWMENGAFITTRPMPGVKIDKSRAEERRVWWNTIIGSYRNPAFKIKAAHLGDGAPIPSEVVEECKAILQEECVAIPWKQGDVLVLDNIAVQHARRPFLPPRRVLAAFTY